MSDMNSNHIKVFISYAHEDSRLKEELLTSLAALKREGIIETWEDREIIPGNQWKNEIDEELEVANIILLLVSPDFIASDYCQGIEVKRALERNSIGEAIVIPVILRPTDWTNTPFANLEAVPENARPVTKWKSHDEAFLNINTGIRRAIQNSRQRTPLVITPPSKGEKNIPTKTLVTSVKGHKENTQKRKIGAIYLLIVILLILVGISTWIIRNSIQLSNPTLTPSSTASITLIPTAIADFTNTIELMESPTIPILTSTAVSQVSTPLHTIQPPILQLITNENAYMVQLVTTLNYPSSSHSTSLAFNHPYGRYLASGNVDGTIDLWDTDSFTNHPPSGDHANEVMSLQFSPVDPDILASASRDTTVRLWLADFEGVRPKDSGIFKLITNDPPKYAVALSPDGRILAEGDGTNEFALWSISDHHLFASRFNSADKLPIYDIAFSPSGTLLAVASADGTFTIWEVNEESDSLLQNPDWGGSSTPYSQFLKIAFSPIPLQYLATGTKDGRVLIWDLAGRDKIHQFEFTTSSVASIAWSPDGSILLACSADGQIFLWNPTNYNTLQELFERPATYACAFSSSGKMIAVATDSGISIFGIPEYNLPPTTTSTEFLPIIPTYSPTPQQASTPSQPPSIPVAPTPPLIPTPTPATITSKLYDQIVNFLGQHILDTVVVILVILLVIIVAFRERKQDHTQRRDPIEVVLDIVDTFRKDGFVAGYKKLINALKGNQEPPNSKPPAT